MSKSNRKYEYVPARLVEGASRCYIVFYVWDLNLGKLVRKRIGVGKVHDKKAKRRECQLKISEIDTLLEEGYVIGGEQEPKSLQPNQIQNKGWQPPSDLLLPEMVFRSI